jgi:hypothetical protein
MGREMTTHFLRLNRSLTNLGGESRHFRLPKMNPFPKLDSRIIRSTHTGEQNCAPPRKLAGHGSVVIEAQVGSLPEMATDVIDVDAGYAVENVKRERTDVRPWSRAGFGHLVGRMLGMSHRAARP